MTLNNGQRVEPGEVRRVGILFVFFFSGRNAEGKMNERKWWHVTPSCRVMMKKLYYLFPLERGPLWTELVFHGHTVTRSFPHSVLHNVDSLIINRKHCPEACAVKLKMQRGACVRSRLLNVTVACVCAFGLL